MTTTFEAFRLEQSAIIAALTPVSFEDVPFVEHRGEEPLRVWAKKYSEGALRRFAIADAFEYAAPGTSDYNSEWVDGTEEILIAYPTTHMYGPQNSRDLQDVMREDEKLIDEKVGAAGYANYTSGICQRLSADYQEEQPVAFLKLRYAFSFYRGR